MTYALEVDEEKQEGRTMTNAVQEPQAVPPTQNQPPADTKKQRILDLYAEGVRDVDELARRSDARPSYVASVLQKAGLEVDYFDLYTSTAQPMNVYSKVFRNQLRFKDEEAARQSVELIEHHYRRFRQAGDRAGQHHCLLMALTMFNRARWIGKYREAEVFRNWLMDKLNDTVYERSVAPADEARPKTA
jgi:hypothetical protein